MEKFYCPNAVLKSAFPNLMCQKKIERNGTKFQNPIECFDAACPHQNLCDCRKQPQNTADYLKCEELIANSATTVAEEPAAEEETKTEKPVKATKKKK